MATDPATLLDLVNAAIANRLAGGAVDSYMIRGRNLKRTPIPDLLELRDQLKLEVELIASGGGLPLIYGVKDSRLAASS